MSLDVGVNSWVTVSEADAYLANKLGAQGWFAIPAQASPGETSRETLLVTAYRWLMSSPQLAGLPAATDVAAFKHAQIEAALFLQRHFDELEEREAQAALGVSSVSMGRRRETFDPGSVGLPQSVLALLAALTSQGAVVVLQGEYDL